MTALSPTTDQVRLYTALEDVPIFYCRVHGIRKEFVADTPIAKTDSQTPRSRTLGSHDQCCCLLPGLTDAAAMYIGPVPALSSKGQRNSGFADVPVTNFLQTFLSPSLDSLMLLSKRWTHGRYCSVYVGLVGLLTLVSQTLPSRTRWSLRRYCPKHRSTEASVRLIGFTSLLTNSGFANARLRIEDGSRSCREPRTYKSSVTSTGFVHVPLTHIKLGNVSFTFAGLPNVALTTTGLSDALSHVHSQTLLSRTRDSHTLLFTNPGLANAPLTNGGLANALSRTRVTKTVP